MLQEFATNVKIVKRYTYFEQFAQYFMQMLQPGAYKWRKIVRPVSKRCAVQFLLRGVSVEVCIRTSINADFGFSFHY